MTIKKRISEHREIYNRNEAQVRRSLIDPILDNLGWSTDDPHLVEHNSQTDERDIPDYTLKKFDRTETYVEAKNLSANIQDHIPQLARYCTNQGIEFGILTNGNDWLVIKAFEKDTKLKDRIVWQVSLENDSVTTIQKKFVAISKEEIGRLPELIEKERQLEKFWIEFIKGENTIVDKLALEMSKEFLSTQADEDYDQETVNSFFYSKIWAFLNNHTLPDSNEKQKNSYYSPKRTSTKNITIQDFQRAGTPSVRDWIEQIPDLRKVNGLSSWEKVCNYLRIDTGTDSARRRLKVWVERNKPNWPIVPEPRK